MEGQGWGTRLRHRVLVVPLGGSHFSSQAEPCPLCSGSGSLLRQVILHQLLGTPAATSAWVTMAECEVWGTLAPATAVDMSVPVLQNSGS